MRRPFIAILAIVVGLAGLAIGMAASRGHHLSPRPLASRLHESAESSSIKPVANAQSQPDVTALVGDDDDGVIRFASNPQPVPPFLLQDLDGNVVSKAQWQGKVVILNSGPPGAPCREEIPILIELAKYKRSLLIVGVYGRTPGWRWEFTKCFI
jgi:hypothetical protein